MGQYEKYIRILGGEERRKKIRQKKKTAEAKNFPNLRKNTNLQIQDDP